MPHIVIEYSEGAGSRIDIESESWNVWTFDDEGRATRLEAFPAHEEDQALKAAGLSE